MPLSWEECGRSDLRHFATPDLGGGRPCVATAAPGPGLRIGDQFLANFPSVCWDPCCPRPVAWLARQETSCLSEERIYFTGLHPGFAI